MTTLAPTPHELMIRKMESIFPLSVEEKQAISALPIQLVDIKTNQDIVREGDEPSQCCLILEGFTCMYKVTAEGKRQILSLYVPGDVPDMQSLHLKVIDINIASISPCKLGFIQHKDLRQLCERYPRLTAAFWRETLVHASIFREWLLNNGQRPAYTRIAHLICELRMRLKVVGLAENGTFEMPATQAELADATGITQVHTNRVLQVLRADGLISTVKTQMHVPDWNKLKQAGEFDSLYLHLIKTATA
ncbi:Crp/Fnr family transcriptional regulator [Vreelandella neptunia]|uniref:Crp/Fnr family transcriptional regulator n=1 Tax=Vreelandella neptunia TaxID=115551 RepID=A0ABS9SAK8_9GAMM|nr:Crp/Fnr family transcriptional regulator [Halomonas neptunia]MCH4813152.1 Crp/Fnr family transcriptional regulator [Halomonas neptunia]